MSAPMVGMVVLVFVLWVAVLALSYRLLKLRQGGTAGIMRDIPAVGGHGWRHGVIRYRGGAAAVYPVCRLGLWAAPPAQPTGCGNRRPARAARRRVRHHDRPDRRVGAARHDAGSPVRLRARARHGRVDRVLVVAGVPALAARTPSRCLTTSIPKAKWENHSAT